MQNPHDLARQLLSPGDRSLFTAMRALRRAEGKAGDSAYLARERLEELATDFPLGDALASAAADRKELDEILKRDVVEQWFFLLERAAYTVKVENARAELQGVIEGLRTIIDPDNEGNLWSAAAGHISEHHHSISEGTLRNRRWPVVRLLLADQIAELLGSDDVEDVLPREPAKPELYGDVDFLRLVDELNNGPSLGLGVLADRPGTGKTEFALAFANWAASKKEGKRRYDQVFWVQGDHPSTLDYGFRRIARRLDPVNRSLDGADVLRRLPSDRWLLVVDDVRNPAWLLRYLPATLEGHVLCTVDHQDEGTVLVTEDVEERTCQPWQDLLAVPVQDKRTWWTRTVGDDAVEKLLSPKACGHLDPAVLESRSALTMGATWIQLFGPDDDPVGAVDLRYQQAAATVRELGLDDGEPIEPETDGKPVATELWPSLAMAYALIEDAHRDRARFDGERVSADAGPDESPFELLKRLAAFGPFPIPINAVRSASSDGRLDRLEQLGLVARNHRGAFEDHLSGTEGSVSDALADADADSRARYVDLASPECFVVHAEVRRALRLFVGHHGPDPAPVMVAMLTARLLSGSFETPGEQTRLLLPHLEAIAASLDGSSPAVGDRHLLLPLTALELYVRSAVMNWRARAPRHAVLMLRETRKILRRGDLRDRLVADLRRGEELGLDPSKLTGHAAELHRDQAWGTPLVRLEQMAVLLRRSGFRSGAEELWWQAEQLYLDAFSETETSRRGYARLLFDGALCRRENEPRSIRRIERDDLAEDGDVDTDHDDRRSSLELIEQAVELIANQLPSLAGAIDDPELAADYARCQALLAVALQDRGDLHDAAVCNRRSLELRARLAATAGDSSDLVRMFDADPTRKEVGSLLKELARGHFVLARGCYYAGLPTTMYTAAGIAKQCWSPFTGLRDRPFKLTRDDHRINESTAAVNEAVAALALRQPDADIKATSATDLADDALGEVVHHDAALVHLSGAWVSAHGDGVDGAGEAAEHAFQGIIRHWPRSHPLVLESRLLAAACHAEAGQPVQALAHLHVLLTDAGLDNGDVRTQPLEDVNRPAVRAAAWAAIGKVLVDLVPWLRLETDTDRDLPATEHATARDCLDASAAAFDLSTDLYDRSPEVRWENEVVAGRHLEAMIGKVEVGLRLGSVDEVLLAEVVAGSHALADLDARQAAEVVARVADLGLGGVLDDVDQAGTSVTILRVMALLARHAQQQGRDVPTGLALPRPFGSASTWADLVKHGKVPGASRPCRWSWRDRIELALGWLAVLPSNAEALESVKTWVEDDIARFSRAVDGEPHPLLALRHVVKATASGETRQRRLIDRHRVLLPRAEIGTINTAASFERRSLQLTEVSS